jgi:hypothetical protein
MGARHVVEEEIVVEGEELAEPTDEVLLKGVLCGRS